MNKRALISVFDKSGAVELAQGLQSLGYDLVSTGSTAKLIAESGLDVTPIEAVTDFPECLDGRLKTLHPKVHGGILAVRGNAKHMTQIKELAIAPIDIVVCNLYPFRETIAKPNVTRDEAIENIDIGGPTMLRAAAKNWQDVCVVVSPDDYTPLLECLQAGEVSQEYRLTLARKVFEYTAQYDAQIAQYFDNEQSVAYPEHLTLTYEKQQDLRYGENPHQTAAYYRELSPHDGDLVNARQLHGKELSYCNINDLNGAIALVKEFAEPCCVAVKHATPCGVGIGECIDEAWHNAYEADKVSIFGGIIALNRECTPAVAEAINQMFIEIVIAPSYAPDALACLTQKKNIRVMELPKISEFTPIDTRTIKQIAGGLLVQSANVQLYESTKRVSKALVTPKQQTQLDFAWKVVKHVRSNAIVLVNGKRTVGIGPGQCNRVTALDIALRYAGANAKGSVMASDAFFPMSDCVEAAAAAGIAAIIQPGGSIRDQDSIDACDKHSIAMLFTGMRHFVH
ncbi:MAG: bifunctional phosphoribosylaminoimidazolecarboxamide formyltransferase/IMP cyclohydrolase [Oscillospiraceae bacterium]|nr:bifunctional phosphoribosylaminoimidazolecarboxamide formyltransferase/IMP cyclohydrolase [Oscillospiraceae bacterium]